MPRSITPDVVRQISSDQMDKRGTKRQHRKAHGKISFRELARVIAKRWKTLDEPSRRILEAQAQVEKQVYQGNMKAFKAYERDVAKAKLESLQNHEHHEEHRERGPNTAGVAPGGGYTPGYTPDSFRHPPQQDPVPTAATHDALRAVVGQRVHRALVAGAETQQQMQDLSFQHPGSGASFSHEIGAPTFSNSSYCAENTAASRFALLSSFSDCVQQDNTRPPNKSDQPPDALLGSLSSTNGGHDVIMLNPHSVESHMEKLRQYKNHIEAEIAKTLFSQMAAERNTQGLSEGGDSVLPHAGMKEEHYTPPSSQQQGPEIFTQLIDPSEIERIFEDDNVCMHPKQQGDV